MGLPLYLAMTGAEMRTTSEIPTHFAYMACHFSPYGEGITNIPDTLPENAMLILNDRMPCQGHSPDLAAQQLWEAVSRLGCESVLLDFLHPPDSESEAMVRAITERLQCPVAVSAQYAEGLHCPVFLPPCPLHIPQEEYLRPWKGREIWLEAALCQEEAVVMPEGASFAPIFPTAAMSGGFFDAHLMCNYHLCIEEKLIRFTLFDTPESLPQKLEHAHALGVSRAVGLWQELGSPE